MNKTTILILLNLSLFYFVKYLEISQRETFWFFGYQVNSSLFLIIMFLVGNFGFVVVSAIKKPEGGIFSDESIKHFWSIVGLFMALTIVLDITYNLGIKELMKGYFIQVARLDYLIPIGIVAFLVSTLLSDSIKSEFIKGFAHFVMMTVVIIVVFGVYIDTIYGLVGSFLTKILDAL